MNNITEDPIGVIRRVFSHLISEPMFQIGNHRIDLYFPDSRIAVEYDKFEYAKKYPTYEEEKEEYIKSRLQCRFFRFDSKCENFLETVINKLIVMIYHDTLHKSDYEFKRLYDQNSDSEDIFEDTSECTSEEIDSEDVFEDTSANNV